MLPFPLHPPQPLLKSVSPSLRLPVLWLRGEVGGRSSIDAALGSFQHAERVPPKQRGGFYEIKKTSDTAPFLSQFRKFPRSFPSVPSSRPAASSAGGRNSALPGPADLKLRCVTREILPPPRAHTKQTPRASLPSGFILWRLDETRRPALRRSATTMCCCLPLRLWERSGSGDVKGREESGSCPVKGLKKKAVVMWSPQTSRALPVIRCNINKLIKRSGIPKFILIQK